MKIQKRPTDPVEYKSPFAEEVTFTLKPLSVSDFDVCTDLYTDGKKGSALRHASLCSIVAWSGYDEAFSKELAKELPSSLLYDIGTHVLTISTVSTTEKN